MADNVTLPGTGAVVGADEVTIGGTPQQVQRVKLVDGTDGGTDLLPGTAARGLSVDPRLKVVRIVETPTISTPAYAAGDNIGGQMVFENAVRSSGGTCRLEALQYVDLAQQRGDLDIVFTDRALSSTPTDNAAFSPGDSDLVWVVAIVPIGAGHYSNFGGNAVADVVVGRSIVLNGTDLYGYIVAREAIDYVALGDVSVMVTITQD